GLLCKSYDILGHQQTDTMKGSNRIRFVIDRLRNDVSISTQAVKVSKYRGISSGGLALLFGGHFPPHERSVRNCISTENIYRMRTVLGYQSLFLRCICTSII